MSEFVSTFVDYYHNGGMIARGPSGGDYTYVMVGDQVVPLIAAAYNKGIRDFDIDAAYAGCLKNSEPGGIRDYAGYGREPYAFMENYVTKGFVPEGLFGKGGHKEGCAITLYFAYEDWCMGQLAKGLGKEDVYRKYDDRSYNYRYVYDRQSGWMRPRIARRERLQHAGIRGEQCGDFHLLCAPQHPRLDLPAGREGTFRGAAEQAVRAGGAA